MKKSLSYKIAEIFSNLFDPSILALVITIVSVYKSKMPGEIELLWFGIILVFNVIVPGVAYVYFKKKGYVFDAPLANKRAQKERIIMLAIFFVMVLGEIVYQYVTHIYQPLFAVLVGGAVTIVIGSIVSYFWKISIHSTLITFFVLMIILLYGKVCWPVLGLIPIMFWSRLVLKRHNISQLMAGFLLSLSVVLITFKISGLL